MNEKWNNGIPVLEYWNNGMNKERKNLNRGFIHKISKLCNFFLINKNFS